MKPQTSQNMQQELSHPKEIASQTPDFEATLPHKHKDNKQRRNIVASNYGAEPMYYGLCWLTIVHVDKLRSTSLQRLIQQDPVGFCWRCVSQIRVCRPANRHAQMESATQKLHTRSQSRNTTKRRTRTIDLLCRITGSAAAINYLQPETTYRSIHNVKQRPPPISAQVLMPLTSTHFVHLWCLLVHMCWKVRALPSHILANIF